MQNQRAAGALPSRAMTLNAWAQTFLEQVAEPRVRPSTLRGYRSDFRLHIIPSLGGYRLDQLQPAHLERLYEAKLSHGLSPNSVRLIHATLRRALNVAVRWGVVSRNVALLVDPPKVPRFLVEPLTISEARQLLRAARGDRLEARWALGLSLGLRQGEVLGLWWSDLDLVTGRLSVVRQLARRRSSGESVRFTGLKTARSVRTLSLPSPLIASLLAHRERQHAEINLCPAWADSRLVFASPLGTPLDHSNDAKAFTRLLNKAGVRRVRLHDLRHTAASLLLADGVHPRVVMELLGHSQIGLTMNTYSHVLPSLLDAAAVSMEGTLWSASDGRSDDASHD